MNLAVPQSATPILCIVARYKPKGDQWRSASVQRYGHGKGGKKKEKKKRGGGGGGGGGEKNEKCRSVREGIEGMEWIEGRRGMEWKKKRVTVQEH